MGGREEKTSSKVRQLFQVCDKKEGKRGGEEVIQERNVEAHQKTKQNKTNKEKNEKTK